MRGEKGITLIELLTVVALASVLLVSVVAYSVPWMAKETMRSAIHDVHALMQLTRIEAVSRNHPCRFLVDTAAGQFEIWDTRGTPATNDDTLLHTRRLAGSVSFQRPDGSSEVVTLQPVDGFFQTVFTPDGLVLAGTGSVFLAGGDKFGRVTVEAAGATRIRYWTGDAWQVGT